MGQSRKPVFREDKRTPFVHPYKEIWGTVDKKFGMTERER